ncbi:MAG: YggL family protein [candidate division KSB1 bacterium]|nr:YggL family protein [candidate division KSB1 bacterium]MDZ7301335.1 YggL family protein [candidate division KSB1 bacterium]MDZ7310780.1 YggL family protein [candidate division KSB1 bacterium]
MRKRLRKKLHLGEFQEMGFEVRFRMSSSLDESSFNKLIDAFIEQAIEAKRLMFGGGGNESVWSGFVTLDRRGSATEQHRQFVQHWLQSQPQIVEHYVGPLIDAWHSDSFH